MTDRVIAIDGPAGSGKSTTAAAVAKKLGLSHLDSGALYRSLTLAAMEQECPMEGPALSRLARSAPVELRLNDSGYVPTIHERDVSEEIRSEAVTGQVSLVASFAEVRDWVNWALGQAASLHPRGVVVDGRDIGSVVFPDAALKVFLVASPDTRALRRGVELGLDGDPDQMQQLKDEILQRDAADSSRAIAPLTKAADAVEIDTTAMSFEQQVARVVELADPLFG